MNLSKIVDSIAAKAAENNPPNEQDYIVDGLLHCHKCGTAKQTRITVFGKELKVFCMCQCMAEEMKREEAAQKADELRQRIERYRRSGFPESDMQNWTFERDDQSDPRTSTVMHHYVDSFGDMLKNGKGLVLYGKCGSGKTFAAACVVNALIDKGYPCLMTNFSRIANTLSGMFEKQAYLDSLNAYALIVLDDLGAERSTEYMNEIVYNIIDARYRANLPMIITSNLSGEDLKHPKDIAEQRVFNRVLERCFPLEVNGPDRRRKTIIREYDGMKKMLGLE